VSPTYKAAYNPLSVRAPNEAELLAQTQLAAATAVIDSSSNSSSSSDEKTAAIAVVAAAGCAWARFVAESLLRAADASGVNCELLVFGSHRLGVCDEASDVDAVLVAPNFCTLAHLFAHFPEQLRRAATDALPLTDVVAVEDAMVPLLCFRLGGASFDLMLVRAPAAASSNDKYLGSAAGGVPSRDVLLGDDRALLRALDSHSARALAGPRGTETLLRLVRETAAPMPVFLEVLGHVRRWARARGVYGNKMGYLGGVNCAILVTLVCQLYPNSAPAALLLRFFQCFKAWKWPNPVVVNCALTVKQPADPDVRLVPWSKLRCPQDLMPIITPSFPAINSSASASAQSIAVMQRELERGHAIADAAMRGKGDWAELFAPSDFFARYTTYIECRILGKDAGWIGFVESRLRRLVQGLETVPVTEIQLFPVAVCDDSSSSSSCCCYYLGLAGVSDPALLQHRLARFRATALESRGGGAVALTCLGWSELPRAVAARVSSPPSPPDNAAAPAAAEPKKKKRKATTVVSTTDEAVAPPDEAAAAPAAATEPKKKKRKTTTVVSTADEAVAPPDEAAAPAAATEPKKLERAKKPAMSKKKKGPVDEAEKSADVVVL
jgi:poly(A) polymerase